MVCGPSKAGKDNLHKNGENVVWTDRLLTISDQKWNNEILSQSIFFIKNQKDANGLPDFLTLLLPHGSIRCQWPRKAQHWGQDVGVVPLQLGSALHFGKPPLMSIHSSVFVPPFRRSAKGCKTQVQPRRKWQ
jgi:hypothetical protein